jgi:beta-lactamase regulating signal transducer with metallopeptidase domain/protocatechuate 3,4-dioxygenase beta subunit
MLSPSVWELFSGWLLKSSGQAAVLVVLVLLVQWLWRRRLPARWRHVLWWIVIARLLLPFFVPGPVSVFNLLPAFDAPTISPVALEVPGPAREQTAESSPAPLVSDSAPTVQRASARALPSGEARTSSARPVLSAATPERTGVEGRSVVRPVARQSEAGALEKWRAGILWGWIVGVILMSGRLAWGVCRLERGLRGATPVEDPATLGLLQRCREQMRVRRAIALLETPLVNSPALCGYWRPRLLFPPGMLANFTSQQLRFILLHELAHVRRADILVNWLTAGLQCLHWFNPMVWLAFHRLRADRELACDALALSVAEPDEYHAYGLTVIKLLENLAPSSRMPGVVGILEDRDQMKRRIRMIGRFRPGTRWSLLSVGLLVILALVGLTDAQTRRPALNAASSGTNASPSNAAGAASGSLSDTNAGVTRIGADPVGEFQLTNLAIRTLTVTVLGQGGRPLPGAEVWVPYVGTRNEARPRRMTDDAGRFVVRFPELPKEHRRTMSNFSIMSRHPDYAQRSVMWTSSAGDVYAGLPEAVTIQLQQGVTVGGTVQDEKGQPVADVRVSLAGSNYKGFTMGNTERRSHEYSEVSIRDDSRAAVTDGAGRWQFPQFPKDLLNVEITFIRPDEAREVFSTEGGNGLNQRAKISLAELKEQKLVTRLRDGYTVRGIVVDEQGRPLSDVKIKEGYGHGNIVRVSEVTNDSNGRFERPHRVARQWLYTASRADRATASHVVQVGPEMSEVRLVLPPAQPWRGRVTDEDGLPLTDVDFRIDAYRTEAQILDWSGTADADGRVVWTNAPEQEVVVYANARSLGVGKKFKLRAGITDQTIVLNRKPVERVVVGMKPVDGETKTPVKVRRVSMRFDGGGSPFKTKAEPDSSEFSVTVERTDFTVGMYPAYEIRLEADGYETLAMKPIDFDSGDQALEPRLTRLRGPRQVTILLPNGEPASGARLWAAAASGDGPLYSNTKGRFNGQRLLKAEADDGGRLDLPGIPATGWMIFTHPQGYLEAGAADLPADGTVRLGAYGAVEGRLLINGKPNSSETLSLTPLAWSPSLRLHVNYTAGPDPDGRFRFPDIPPGQYKLYRWALPKRRDTSGQTITETYQHPVTVVAGQTNEVEYYTPGRQILGQAVPSPANILVDWPWDVHTLTLKLPAVAGNGGVNREDYATFDAFQKANTESYAAPGRWELARQARTYSLRIERDGTFGIDDVPPGTYELRIGVTKPNDDGQPNRFGRHEELGSLIREVIVPPGQEPLDLGSMVVPIQADLLTAGSVLPGEKAGPILALEARTLSGRKMNLSQFAGTNVLLVFWASWSERSLSQWPQLQELAGGSGDGRLALVGVSLDDTLEDARRTVSGKRWKGTHVWVDAERRAQLTAAFEVSTLPGVYLVDAGGRIVARELEGERLGTTLKRVLAKK